MQPKITIIIPVYNVEKYLRQCLDSVCKQTLQEIEIIVVNDGSKDSSLEIIREFEKKDERIVVIDKANSGYGSAINSGLERATGKYIGIVESDDYILPNMYKRLYETAEEYNYELDIIKSDTIQFWGDDSDNESEKKIVSVVPKELYNHVLCPREETRVFSSYILNQPGIYKHSVIKEHNIRLNETPGAAFQDNGFWFQMFMWAEKVMFIPEGFYMYRQDRVDSSTNCVSFENAVCIFKEFEFIHDLLMQSPIEKQKDYWAVFIARFTESGFYHYGRVIEDYKLIYLRKFSKALNEYASEKKLDYSLVRKTNRYRLKLVMDDPKSLYYNDCVAKVSQFMDVKTSDTFKEYQASIVNMEAWKRRENMNESKRPLVSVVIAVYNMSRYIEECMKSVLEQTLTDIEVICVDDGSTDCSLQLLMNYMLTDSRVFVTTQKNAGSGPARNVGMKLARGEYIAFMDPDDFYPNNETLEKLYKTAKAQNVEVCAGSFINYISGEFRDSNQVRFYGPGEIWFKDYQKIYGHQAFLISRDLIHRNNFVYPPYRIHQDANFLAEVLYNAEKFYVIPDFVYVYRFEPGHVSWNQEKIYDLIKSIKDLLTFAHERELDKLYYFSFDLLQRVYKTRIVNYCEGNVDIIRLLCAIEGTLDTDMLRSGSNGEYNTDVRELLVVSECIRNYSGKELKKQLEEKEKLIKEMLKEKAERWHKTQALLKEKGERWHKLQALKKEKTLLIKHVNELEKELNKAKKEKQKIYDSRSWKVGRFITYIPRKIRKLFKI